MTMEHGGGSDVILVALHRRPDLIDPCVDLLNAQWPRSKAARLHSLDKSCDGLPYSLVMVHSKKESSYSVIGYCRLARVISVPSSVLIESVVVPETLRGKGLGRQLMELAEAHAKMQGFNTMYLNTKDKQDFYGHLGYTFCPAVNTLNAQMLETCDCSAAACCSPSPDQPVSSSNCLTPSSPSEKLSCRSDVESGDSSSDKPCLDCPASSDDGNPTGQAGDQTRNETSRNVPLPPPPPPPPLVIKDPLNVVYWMKKDIA